MEIVENITFAMPPISAQLNELTEAAKTGNKGKALIIEVASIHEGATANHNYYSERALSESVESWTSPYGKPILRNHDTNTEPLGRVIKARMDKAADGTPYMKLQVMISDPHAIEKIGDKRYLTGSVGATAKKVNCSVCEADWSNVSMFGKLPCDHERGKEYDGKIAQMKVDDLSWKEYSFVNVPADGRSQVLGVVSESVDFVELSTPKFYSLDLDKESIFELTESQNVDVLANLARNEANSIYEGLKEVFLSTLQNELSEEESMEESEDDILDAISSVQNSDTEEKEVAEGPEDDDVVNDEPQPEVAGDPDADGGADDEPVDADAEADPDADGAEDDTDETPEDGGEGDEVVDPTEEPAAETDEEQKDEPLAEAELNEKIATLESRVEELEAQNAALTEKNAQLKNALKKILAEQVVDTRISMGLANAEDRGEMVEEYSGRSAQSLADSLKDLYSMTNAPSNKIFKIKPASLAVKEEGEPVVDEELVEEKKVSSEDLFVEVLMGRKEL